MVTLTVCREVFQTLNETFLSSKQEAGFILGCQTRLDCLDSCEQVPANQAGVYFYRPDASYANHIIQKWQAQRICFCGFIHSHVVNKQDLSEADVQFAQALFRACPLPVLWFGLAIALDGHVTYRFFSVTEENGSIHIRPVSFTKSDIGDDRYESLHC